MNEPPPNYGEIAYNAYCETRNWKSFNDDPLPRWPEVLPGIQASWQVAACTVLWHFGNRLAGHSWRDLHQASTKAQTP